MEKQHNIDQLTRGHSLSLLLAAVFFTCCSENSSVSHVQRPTVTVPELYQEIIANPENEKAAVSAIEAISRIYEERIREGIVLIETDRVVITEAFPVIINFMSEDNAMDFFRVLAYVQEECPVPRKEDWLKWWKRKQEGERIKWMMEFE